MWVQKAEPFGVILILQWLRSAILNYIQPFPKFETKQDKPSPTLKQIKKWDKFDGNG